MIVSRALITIVVLANTVSSCLVDGPVHFHLEVERSLSHPLSFNMISVKCPRCVVPHVDRVCTKSSYRCTTTLSLAWNPVFPYSPSYRLS